MQERIIAEGYVGPDGQEEHFKATLFIVMCNRLVTCVVAFGLLTTSGQPVLPQAPIWNYAAVSGALPVRAAVISTASSSSNTGPVAANVEHKHSTGGGARVFAGAASAAARRRAAVALVHARAALSCDPRPSWPYNHNDVY